MGTKKALTAEEFEWIRPHLERIEERNLVAVKRVLVDGVMQKEVALDLKMTKEAVSALVAKVWRVHLMHGVRPAGWEKIEVVLPPDMIQVVHELARIARTKETK